jgi:hypothetical protein
MVVLCVYCVVLSRGNLIMVVCAYCVVVSRGN